MSTLLFYKTPKPLDRNTHKNLKLKRQNSMAFAEDANSVPVAGFEFFLTSRDFPIVFIKNAKDEYMPIALLSLRDKGHDLGETWKDVYVPSFVRRYPFALGTDGVIVFDADSPHMQEEEGEAMFDEKGEATDTLKEVVKFLQQTDVGYKATSAFSKALAEKELLEPFKGEVKFANTTIKLEHLFVINEKKLHDTLSETEVFEWFNKGWIAWSHAHLHSLSSISVVAKRAINSSAAPSTATKESDSVN